MNSFLSKVLSKIDGDPERLGEVFAAKLSLQEELMLGKLDEEIGIRVDRLLDAALSDATTINNGEIIVETNVRTNVHFLTAVRRAIHKILSERGSLQMWRAGLS